MFGLVKQIFVPTIMFFGCNLSSINPLECVLMNNKECKVNTEIANVNCNKPVFYPLSIKTSKCSGSCNNINDPYARLCVPDVEKKHIKVMKLMKQDT